MSNPWAQSFEDLRSPYLQEKKAKKDYDGDGKIESGAKEYRGVVHNKIQKAKGGKADGQDTSSVKEHHQKDANGNPVEHGDGTPASVPEAASITAHDVNYGTKAGKDFMSGARNKAGELKYKLRPAGGMRIKTVDSYEPEGDMVEAKIDKIDPKNKRKRRNEATFGKQTKPYDPPGKAYKNEMSKFLQKQRKERHDKMRGVKKEEVVLEADKKGKGSGTKDACYHKVKSRYSVWPSAYASGALVKCRKAGAKNWGNSSKKEEFDYYQMPMKSFGDMVGECWKTHKKVGMKMKGGKMVPDCRPKNEERTPALNDTSFSQEYKDNAKKAIEASRKKNTKVKMEAVKSPKLDIKETGVKNKIEINPEIKTEAAKAPEKK